jgi:hypothetical protein
MLSKCLSKCLLIYRNMSWNRISEFRNASTIMEFEDLQTLDFSHNLLTTIPARFYNQFRFLRALYTNTVFVRCLNSRLWFCRDLSHNLISIVASPAYPCFDDGSVLPFPMSLISLFVIFSSVRAAPNLKVNFAAGT